MELNLCFFAKKAYFGGLSDLCNVSKEAGLLRERWKTGEKTVN